MSKIHFITQHYTCHISHYALMCTGCKIFQRGRKSHIKVLKNCVSAQKRLTYKSAYAVETTAHLTTVSCILYHKEPLLSRLFFV